MRLSNTRVKTNAQFTLMTNDDLSTLCWLCKAGDLMRQNHKELVEGLYDLKSEYAPSFLTMSRHYLMLIKQAKAILEGKLST